MYLSITNNWSSSFRCSASFSVMVMQAREQQVYVFEVIGLNLMGSNHMICYMRSGCSIYLTTSSHTTFGITSRGTFLIYFLLALDICRKFLFIPLGGAAGLFQIACHLCLHLILPDGIDESVKLGLLYCVCISIALANRFSTE